ncbi:5426_t:CDS:2, partial [Cetraspora pellucida]
DKLLTELIKSSSGVSLSSVVSKDILESFKLGDVNSKVDKNIFEPSFGFELAENRT